MKWNQYFGQNWKWLKSVSSEEWPLHALMSRIVLNFIFFPVDLLYLSVVRQSNTFAVKGFYVALLQSLDNFCPSFQLLWLFSFVRRRNKCNPDVAVWYMLFAKFLEPLGSFELWQQVILLLAVKTLEGETVAILVVDLLCLHLEKPVCCFPLKKKLLMLLKKQYLNTEWMIFVLLWTSHF